MMAAPWILMMAIMSMAYASTVVSFLTVRKLNAIPNSIEYFANNPAEELLMIKEYQLTYSIMNAESGPLKELGDIYRRKPHLLMSLPTHKVISQHVLKGRAFIGPSSFILSMVGEARSKNGGKCLFMVTKLVETTRPILIGFGLPKNGPYNSIITEKLSWITAYGHDTQLVPGTFYNIDDCKYGHKIPPQLRVITLKNLSGAFLLLVVGLVVTFVAFLYEHIVFFIEKKKNNIIII